MSFFLSIKDDNVVITRNHGYALVVVSSVAMFHQYVAGIAAATGEKIEDVPVYASSSMDFPEEFTDNPDTIKLARALRA